MKPQFEGSGFWLNHTILYITACIGVWEILWLYSTNWRGLSVDMKMAWL